MIMFSYFYYVGGRYEVVNEDDVFQPANTATSENGMPRRGRHSHIPNTHVCVQG